MAEVQLVAVAFTDLVGSTDLFSRLDRAVAEELRAAHFALLRRAIAAHGGTEVKNLGDGLMVVFSSTSGALNCAEAMQQTIDRHNRTAPEPLSIRVGLSHGEVTEDGGDYFGDAVVEAARLCGVAEGGQILATQLVQLTAGRRATQQFVSVGDLELKGLPDPVATVEVRWAPAEAPDEEGAIPLPARCSTTPVGGFVGRVAERAVLTDAFKQAASEARHRVVLVGGEPGMGKTTLATECAHAAYQDGAIVLYGRADEDLGVPYQPWAEALTHLIVHAPQSLLESIGPHGSSLLRLAPTLVSTLGTHDAPTTTDPEAARYILFGAVTSTLATAGELAPVVVVLDDLQWADAPSLQLLRHLAANNPMRVLVIGTFRESDIGAGHPLADLLSALHRETGTERISLRGLSDLELLALMEAFAGQTLEEDGLALRDALLAETDGNPFFVGELLRHLAETGAIYQEEGHWVASADLRERGLPVSVKEVIGRRVTRLGDEETRVLAVASVIGRDFDLGLLASVSETDEATLLDLLDAAVEATLVLNVAGERYSFVHALIEHTLYDSLTPARRARLHRRVAEAIESQSRGETDGRVAELAYHFAQATAPEDVDKAVFYARAAGDAALAQLAPDEALRWYSQALSLLEQRQDEDELRCQLLVGLGNAQRQTGEGTYRETLLEAAHLAEGLGATDLLVSAALANNRGFHSASGVIDTERVAVLEAACDALEGSESAEYARLLALLASELTFGGDVARRRELADRSLAIARTVGDPATLAGVINSVQLAINVPETLAERMSLSAEGFGAARSAGDPVLEFWSAVYRSWTCYQAGEVAEGDDVFGVALDIGERLGQPILRWDSLFGQSRGAIGAGDLKEAERLAVEAAEIGTATGQPDTAAVFAVQFGYVRTMQGRADEIVDLVRQTAIENPGLPGFSTILAQLYCDLDRPDDARAILEPFVADGFRSVPMDLAWLTTVSTAAYAVAELGWTEPAATLYEMLRPFPSQIPDTGPTRSCEVSYFLARLATTLGRYDEAEAYYSQASATHERIGAAWALAMTQLAWGRFLVTRGTARDLDRASTLLEQALHSAREHGYALAERRSLQALEALRSHRG